jgi:hypothetical protein
MENKACDANTVFGWDIAMSRTVALGLTQPLTVMSSSNISWGDKGSQCIGLTTLPPSGVNCLEIESLNLLEPSGPVQACNGIALPLHLLLCI